MKNTKLNRRDLLRSAGGIMLASSAESGSAALSEVRRIEPKLLSGAAMFQSFAAIAADKSVGENHATALLRAQISKDA